VAVSNCKLITTRFIRAYLLVLDFTYTLRIAKALIVNENRETTSKCKDMILKYNMPPDSTTHLYFPYRKPKELRISM
jgi:hypothetical protein